MAEHVITPLYACSFELSHDEYQTRYDDLAADGYRLLLVDGYRSGSELRYGGIWLRDQGAVLTAARHGLTSSEYQTEYDDLRRRGYLIKGVKGISSAAGSTAATFAAVWNDGSFLGYRTHHDMTASDYQAQLSKSVADGFQVIYVTGYASGTSSRYAAIWSEHNRSQKERHNLSSSEYQTTFVDLEGQGFRIAHVNAHEAGDKTFFAGIFVKEDGYDPAGRHNMSVSGFRDKCQELAAADSRLTCMSGYREAGQDKYAAIWAPHSRAWLVHGQSDSSLAMFDSEIESFMKHPKRTIPGGSLAVTRNNELVLARGYSWITDLETPVEPTSLFRLASVSKTLTGAGIVLLDELGQADKMDKFSLSDKLVDRINIPGTITDSRIKKITVEHLLYHVGGWNRDAVADGGSGIDPLKMDIQISKDYGMSLPITRAAIIRWTNEKYTNNSGKKGFLDFDPGKIDGAKYSNYGFMLLGQIIENVTGVPYEQFIQERLLTPLGIRRMRLGRTLLRQRLPNEVLYHAPSFTLHDNLMAAGAPHNVMPQYGGVRSIASAAFSGGWIGSAVDLVRFASSLNDPNNCPILSKSSVDKLFAVNAYGNQGPTDPDHFGCGWTVNAAGEPSKTGGMEGTSTAIMRWHDKGDIFWAALLFNKSDDDESDAVGWDLRGLIRQTVAKITSWPTGGFWEDYF